MASSRLCDSCKSTAATLFCRADAAFLCGPCDSKIHTANKLASRHERVYLCEVCEQAPAHVTCKADAAALCVTCDRDIHSANPLSSRHERIPITPFHDSVSGSVKSASSFVNDDDDDDGEAASWLLPKEGGETEISNFFTDLEYPKIEVTSEENSSGNDGVVPINNKLVFLNNDYFNIDISASKGFSFINQSDLSRSLDVALVPESGGGATTATATATVTMPVVQLSPAEREARVLRYREKRKNRKFEKTIRYASRKAYAEMRPRIKGRFAKRTESRGDDGGGDGGVYGGFGVVPSF
ncbi:hypothetical protein CARUB_v10023746mg [Capsella rubella]|uniref:CONSTANS-like 3 protein n=1 Tax=Capsella rubella TaxID=81985 RepID=R0FXZ6_9BRAS|nr:zinc finger protein CONSTANS-LIKE 3 [Capsella rubella]EOA27606.1 hypothetical protein CARUB_v10023746mg [Capsella rubella]